MVNTRRLEKPQSPGEDRLSKLSDNLLCKIMSNLSSKDTVRTSVLSKRWEKLWLAVPALDLDACQFHDEWDLLEFMDRSIESREGLCLDVERFRLVYDVDEHDHDDFVSRIDEVIRLRVSDLTIMNRVDVDQALVRMPLSLYTCATLVSLVLHCVVFDAPESESIVSLPFLKSMHLEAVKYDGGWILESLISNSPVLEELVIIINPHDDFLEVVSVRSKSLRSFKLESWDMESENPKVEVDTPRLEYLIIDEYKCDNVMIHSIGPVAKVNIDLIIDGDNEDPLEIHDFFTGISTAREMIISPRTLEVIDELETLPQFSNLSRLDVSFVESSLELFPTFLGCFPHLQSLVLEFDFLPEEIQLTYVPPCFLSPLEIIQLKTPNTEAPSKLKLAVYFVRNCAVLKKLMVSKSFENIITKIKTTPMRSRGCQVVMLFLRLYLTSDEVFFIFRGSMTFFM